MNVYFPGHSRSNRLTKERMLDFQWWLYACEQCRQPYWLQGNMHGVGSPCCNARLLVRTSRGDEDWGKFLSLPPDEPVQIEQPKSIQPLMVRIIIGLLLLVPLGLILAIILASP